MNRQKLFPKYANLTKPDTTATDEEIDQAHQELKHSIFAHFNDSDLSFEDKQLLILMETQLDIHQRLGDMWKWMKHRR